MPIILYYLIAILGTAVYSWLVSRSVLTEANILRLMPWAAFLFILAIVIAVKRSILYALPLYPVSLGALFLFDWLLCRTTK